MHLRLHAIPEIAPVNKKHMVSVLTEHMVQGEIRVANGQFQSSLMGKYKLI